MRWRIFQGGRDSDGQPLSQSLNVGRREVRSVDEVLGFLKGILADGKVLPIEIRNLASWLSANVEDDTAMAWPFCEIIPRLLEAVSDGVVTDEECEELGEIFRRLTSVDRPTGSPTRTVISATEIFERNPSTELPLTDPAPEVIFKGKSFVFTGKFYFGTRINCQLSVHERGGECTESVTKNTDYLVIGTLGSRDWLHTNYGRKIEAAAELARKGSPIALVSEQHWSRFII